MGGRDGEAIRDWSAAGAIRSPMSAPVLGAAPGSVFHCAARVRGDAMTNAYTGTRQSRTHGILVLALLAALLVLPLALAPRAEAFVYWTDPVNNAIGRANLDGTGVDKRFISGVAIPGSVAVDARHIYWGGFVRV